MRKLVALAAFGAALMLGDPARAADVPTKAPPAVAFTGYPYNSDGFYGGIGAVGEILSADLGSAAGTSSVYSTGAALDVTFGYQWAFRSTWMAIEASAQYVGLGGSVSCVGGPCAVSSTWGFEQRGLVGFPIDLIAGLLPNFGAIFPALPALPAGVTVTTSHPYVYMGLREDDISATYLLASAKVWKVQPVFGLGIRSQWKAGLVVDTSAGCTIANAGFTLDVPTGATVSMGRDCRAAVRFLF